MVFQNPAAQMLAPTVEDEILFGLENLGLRRADIFQRLEEALSRFGLTHMRQRAPQTLSGGEQQKLALAAITARRPAALVLDEPLSMLDTTSALEFISHTRELVSQRTSVVYCEHRHEYLSGIPDLLNISLGCDVRVPGQNRAVPAWPLPPREPFELVVCGLHVARGGRTILRDLDLALPSGKTIALVGRNGVGKTTLFRTLTGLQKYEGTIEIQVNGRSEPPQLGMVFQNPDLQLFNPSVRDEILYRVERPDTVLYEWVMDSLGLVGYEKTPPLLLSEGEKRRVALATMLVRMPRHGLLLDEPALGQDEIHKETLLRLLRAYAGAGYLVVYSTHDLDLAAQADHLVLLGPEGIAAQGRAADILQMEQPWHDLGFVLPEWIRKKWSA